MPQIVLPHKYGAQLTGYTCGPAATKHVLSTAGRNDLTEAVLARECGTTVNGTDDIANIVPVLKKYTAASWGRTGMPIDPPTSAQVSALRAAIVNTVVNQRRGMVVNIVAPPGNNLPGYPNYTVWHYIAVVGYDTDKDLVYLADSARFSGYEHYWVSTAKLASLIPPKAYASLPGTATPPPAPAAPATYFDSDRSSEFAFGGPRSTAQLVGIAVHTTESGKSATATAKTADNVTTYQATSQTGSYNVMIGVDGKRIRQNTDGWITWSTGNKGNNILLHLCFVGNASQTRAEWLAQDKMLRAGATVIRYWCDKYRFPLKKVTASSLPGILGHVDTRVWGGTDHTDPGPNFPYDRLIEYAVAGTNNGGFLMALNDSEQRELLEKTRYIADQLGPGYDAWGEDGDLGKNAKGQRLTLRAGLAKLLRGAK